MKKGIELIVLARNQLRKDNSESKKTKYWKTVGGILGNHDFMLLVCDEMRRLKCDEIQAVKNVMNYKELYLNGKRGFKQDDMIEIKGACKYLIEFALNKKRT